MGRGAGGATAAGAPVPLGPAPPRRHAGAMAATGSIAGRLAVIDDSPLVLEAVAKGLEDLGWVVYRALGGRAGIRLLDEVRPDVAVCDLHMPDVSGLEVVAHAAKHHPNLPVVVLSGDADLSAVLGAVRRGAFDYVVKAEADLRPLGEAVRRALDHARLRQQNRLLQADLDRARERLAAQLREVQRQHELLTLEQRKSESLLLNVLPRRIAERLKGADERRLIADEFERVTVLFGDIVGFTPMCSTMAPDRLVALLNDLFSRFDQLALALGVEKVKTIGDAWMAAAGLPVPAEDPAEAAALLALRMQHAVAEFDAERDLSWRLRIGLHSGKVVAGVIGQSKFIYDLWGDTVNLAARMESHGVPGGVQMTEATRLLLPDRFRCESRGVVDVKGKGEMPVYLLTGLA